MSAVIPYARVRAAMDKDDLRFLIRHAHELPPLSLGDALEICLLYRDQDPTRYVAAALRWLSRFACEARGASLRDVQRAAAALDELCQRPEEAMERLSRLCVDHGLSGNGV